MASVPTITFNGSNITTFGGFLVSAPDGWLGGPDVQADVAELVGGVGGVVAETMTVRPRTLVLDLGLYATSLATLRGYEDALNAYQRKDVTVRIADGTNTREIDGRLLLVKMSPRGVPLSLHTTARCTFLCADPYWRATSDTTETINGTPNTLALSSGVVAKWVLTITATTNSITDITITLGPNTLVYTGTIAASQALVIDANDFTVENNGVDALASYTGGFPVLDPRDAPAVSAVKASGSGTLGGSLVYRIRY